MKVSTKGRYGLRVMVDLALYDNGEYISLSDISAREDISMKYLEQIMRLLVNSKMVKSLRGSNGGYRLADKAENYSVLMVLEACEGDLTPVECIADKQYCTRCSSCTTYSFWQELDDYLKDYLRKKSIKDIADKARNYDYII